MIDYTNPRYSKEDEEARLLELLSMSPSERIQAQNSTMAKSAGGPAFGAPAPKATFTEKQQKAISEARNAAPKYGDEVLDVDVGGNILGGAAKVLTAWAMSKRAKKQNEAAAVELEDAATSDNAILAKALAKKEAERVAGIKAKVDAADLLHGRGVDAAALTNTNRATAAALTNTNRVDAAALANTNRVTAVTEAARVAAEEAKLDRAAELEEVQAAALLEANEPPGGKPSAAQEDKFKSNLGLMNRMVQLDGLLGDMSPKSLEMLGSQGRDIISRGAKVLPGGIGEAAASAVYENDTDALDWLSQGANIESMISKQLHGSQVTSYEMKDREKWSPFVKGIPLAQKRTRMAAIKKALNDERAVFSKMHGDKFTTLFPINEYEPRASKEDPLTKSGLENIGKADDDLDAKYGIGG